MVGKLTSWRVYETVSSSGIRVTWSVHFPIPVVPTVNLMVARIGPELSTSNSNGVLGQIYGTIKSSVAELESVPWAPPCKIGEQSL